jgi:hypothetical protein
MLMKNYHFALFKLLGNWLKTKNMCSLFPRQHGISYLLEHIFKKMGSTEIVVSSVRPSVCPSVRPSVRPSVSYFSAAIAPRELKFST